jgi:hypothetical protein
VLSAASATAADLCMFIGTMASWNGAMAVGQIMPRSSWFCSIAAATMRLTPMP